MDSFNRTADRSQYPPATQTDPGWQQNTAKPPRNPTQADTGWPQAGSKPPRVPTQADTGWNNERPRRTPTEADTGWIEAAARELDPANVMNRATANAFPDIDSFKDAVGRLSVLISSRKDSYAVKRTLSRAGGESAILLCTMRDGHDVAAKVYYEPVNSPGSSISARTRVLQYMQTPEGQEYTLAVSDFGLVELGGSRYYFEIMPYCPEGDLLGTEFSYQELLSLTGHLNEALHSMHSAGILHRDIKPDNLYRLNGRVVIGDFGVAKLVNAGASEYTVRSIGYAAPETQYTANPSHGKTAFFFDEKCDYYSLGVTLASLFEGHFIYESMTPKMITSYALKGRLPLTKQDPHREQLENLLSGLYRYEPRHRFDYDDVCRWLVDQDYTGGVSEDEWPRKCKFLGEEFADEKSLFFGITKDAEHWNEGKERLYGKYFEQFFKSFQSDLARAAQKAEEEWRTKDEDKGLAVFLKQLYAPGPIVWKGYTFASLQELAGKMAVTGTPVSYSELLRMHYVSHWLANTEGIHPSEKTIELVDLIEAQAQQEPDLACYWFGNSFAKERCLTICGRTVSDIGGLMHALFSSPRAFYSLDGFAKLQSRDTGADLYGFLFSFGYRKLIEQAWETAVKCDPFGKAALLFSLLDKIAFHAGTDPEPVRTFFLYYGPLGFATFTKALAERKNAPVYVPLDAEGKRILRRISTFQAPDAQSVDELYRAYAPLLKLLESFQKILIDNPFLVSSGAYERRGILCTNLIGSYYLKIDYFGIMAPAGFLSRMESETGGTV